MLHWSKSRKILADAALSRSLSMPSSSLKGAVRMQLPVRSFSIKSGPIRRPGAAFPPLYTTRKDHNECNDENVGPPTRPVCGVTVAANSRLSYMLNIILTEVWKRNNDTVCMSTEDMKAEIDRVNATLSNKKIIIGSADVKALYPSLDIPFLSIVFVSAVFPQY